MLVLNYLNFALHWSFTGFCFVLGIYSDLTLCLALDCWNFCIMLSIYLNVALCWAFIGTLHYAGYYITVHLYYSDLISMEENLKSLHSPVGTVVTNDYITNTITRCKVNVSLCQLFIITNFVYIATKSAFCQAFDGND